MSSRAPRSWTAALVCAGLLNLAQSSIAEPEPRDAGKSAVPRPPLLPLPKPPNVALPPPTAAELAALDELLARLSGADVSLRDEARRTLSMSLDHLLPALNRRVTTVSGNADKLAMKRLLGNLRSHARDAVRRKMRARGTKGRVETPDYLDILLASPTPDDAAWRDLVAVVGISRALVGIGTTPAARVLVEIRTRFGEFLRADTQLQLSRIGEHAIPALIEATRHPALDIARWAERQLELRGKAIPGEAVQTEDPVVQADVLRALGRTRDPDAARLIISFASSERATIRDAARQAVAMLGEVGNWQLRDGYEAITGRRPPREWSWDRTARELFGEYDRIRLSEVYRLFGAGQAKEAAGDYAAMKRAYDKVLARSPMFEHGVGMVRGYLEFAKRHLDENPDAALDALARAKRLGGEEHAAAVESLYLTAQAEQLLSRGIADQTLLTRALELDPSNERAKTRLQEIEAGEVTQGTRRNRLIGATVILLLALFGVAFIAIRRWFDARPPATPKEPS